MTTSASALHPRTRRRRPEFLALWREAWQHELCRLFRAKPRWSLTPGLAGAAILVVWALFIGGTGLAVAAYPEATHVECDWFTCHYRMLEQIDHPLETLPGLVSSLLFGSMCLILPGLLLILSAWSVVRIVRGRAQFRFRGITLASAWHNDVITLLTLTPPAPDGLVRIRLLCRLNGIWRQRALIALVFSVLATYFVSVHVVYPIFWWLGPWQQWGAQLLLVLLWGGAVVVGLIWLVTLQLLSEVGYQSDRGLVGGGWQTLVPAGVLLALGSVIGLSRLHMLSFENLRYHDANVHAVVSMPLILILTAAPLSALNYALAQAVFHYRTNHLDRHPAR